ncbi:MAG: galactokinase family protein [Gemmatimonadales bacterium]
MKPDERARGRFTSEFGHPPAALAAAPGRVNLIGEHVDLYGGHVLPVATTWRTAVAVGPGSGRLRAVSEQGARVETDWPPRRAGQWSDYVAGVAALWTGVPFEGGLDVAQPRQGQTNKLVSGSPPLELA